MEPQYIVYRVVDNEMEVKVFNNYMEYVEFEKQDRMESYVTYIGRRVYEPWQHVSSVEIKLHDKVTFNKNVANEVNGYIYKEQTHSFDTVQTNNCNLEVAKGIVIKALNDLKQIGFELNSDGSNWSLEGKTEIYISKNKFGTEV